MSAAARAGGRALLLHENMHSRTAYLLGIILGAIVFFSTCSTVLRARLLALKTAAQSLVNRSSPVPIELLVMSKCPDKVYCEQVFGQVCKYNTSRPFILTLEIRYC